jgi:hypothetical protein
VSSLAAAAATIRTLALHVRVDNAAVVDLTQDVVFITSP